MAKRVDTKFVITLSSALVLIAGAVVGYWFWQRHHQRDPVYLLGLARAAEAKGDDEQAIRLYTQAHQNMTSKQEEISEKIAELSYQYSATDIKYYYAALSAWKQALTENRNYIMAADRLVKELYARTPYLNVKDRPAVWLDIRNYADSILKQDPKNGNAYLYRGVAILSQATTSQLNPEQMDLARKDIEQAVKLLPDDSEPLVRLVFMDLVQAKTIQDSKQADKATDAAIARLTDFAVKHPKDSKIRLTLGDYYFLQVKKPDEALKWYRDAVQANPGDANTYTRLSQIILSVGNTTNTLASAQKEAEELVKKGLEGNPNNMDLHYLLASLYQGQKRFPEAIEQFKTVLALKGNAAGIDAERNLNILDRALYELTETYMNLAEAKGIGSAEGKAAAEGAAESMDRIKGHDPKAPRYLMLNGRMLVLRGRLPEATRFLSDALARFTPEGNWEYWYQTQMLLVEAYNGTGDLGAALEHLTAVTQASKGAPGYTRLMNQRALLLLRSNRPVEAKDVCIEVLKIDRTNDAAERILASAYYAVGDKANGDMIVHGLPADDAALAEAMQSLLGGDPKSALEQAEKALETRPDQIQALGIAVSALLQEADKAPKDDAAQMREKAKKYINQALAKDPKNEKFTLLKVLLDNPNKSADEVKLAVIDSMPDEFQKLVAKSFYWLSHKGDAEPAGSQAVKNQIDSLRQAETKAATPAQQQEIVDRIFNAALAAEQWDIVGQYAQRAEAMNLDGVDGKFYRGRMSFAKGNKEDGLRILKEATTLRPEYSMGWTILGQALVDSKQPDQARSAFERAVQQNPGNLMAIKDLIQLKLNMNTAEALNSAKEDLKAALRWAPRDPQLRSYDDLIGDPREVIATLSDSLQRAQGQGAEEWSIRRSLANAYVRASAPERAIEVIVPMYEHFPDDLMVANALAMLYRDTGKADKALKLYEPFIASKDAAVQYQALLDMGSLYRAMGQTTEAVKMFQTALTKEPAGVTDGDRRLADLYFDTGDYTNAEKLYHAIYDKDTTKDRRVLLRWIETLVDQGKFHDADDMLNNQVLREHPDDEEGMALRGYSLLRQRRTPEAIACFNTVLDKDPDYTRALYFRALSQYSMQGDLDQAIKDLLHVRSIHENALDSLILLARVYRQSRQYPESVKVYRDILVSEPNFMEARLEYSNFLYSLCGAAIHMNGGSPDAVMMRTVDPINKLQELIAESTKLFPQAPAWPILQGNLLVLLNNTAAAAEVQRHAAEMSEWSPVASIPYLNTLLVQKNYDRVIETSTRMLATNSNFADLYLKRGAAYAGQNKMTEALADFDKGLDLASSNFDQYLNVIRQLFIAVPDNVAIAHLKDRLKGDPKNLAIHMGLAQVYLTDSRPSDAIDELEPMLADKNAEPLRQYVLQLLALARYQNHDFAKSEELYNELLKYRPNDLEALNNLAFLLASDLKRPEEGLKVAERAMKILKLEPTEVVYVNNGNVMDTYGWIEFLNGNLSKSFEDLQRALQADPLPITYLHIGQVLQKQGKLGEAKRYLQQGLDLAHQKNDPVAADIDKAIKGLH